MGTSSAIRAGSAFVELFLKDQGLVSGLNKVASKISAFGAGISAVGAKIAGLGTAIVAPFLASAYAVANGGEEMLRMSQRTGITVEALSELKYVAMQSNLPMEDLAGAIGKMQVLLGHASVGSEDANKKLARLGIVFSDLAGLSPDEQFQAIAQAISEMGDASQRAAAATDIFGRSGRNLLPIMAGGADGVQEMRNRLRELGGVTSTAGAEAGAKLNQSMREFAFWTKKGLNAIGATIIPILTEFIQARTLGAQNDLKWIKANKDLVVSIFEVGVALVVGGTALMVLGKVIGTTSVLFSGLATVLGLVFSPLGLITAGVAALGYALYQTKSGRDALGLLGDGFAQVKSDAVDAFQGIRDALDAGEYQQAIRIMMTVMELEFRRGVDKLKEIWHEFKAELADTVISAGTSTANLAGQGGIAFLNFLGIHPAMGTPGPVPTGGTSAFLQGGAGAFQADPQIAELERQFQALIAAAGQAANVRRIDALGRAEYDRMMGILFGGPGGGGVQMAGEIGKQDSSGTFSASGAAGLQFSSKLGTIAENTRRGANAAEQMAEQLGNLDNEIG